MEAVLWEVTEIARGLVCVRRNQAVEFVRWDSFHPVAIGDKGTLTYTVMSPSMAVNIFRKVDE